jgi:hypothetical protein
MSERMVWPTATMPRISTITCHGSFAPNARASITIDAARAAPHSVGQIQRTRVGPKTSFRTANTSASRGG